MGTQKGTLILTTFNRNKQLQLGLESIRRYSDIRTIVANDGAEDQSREIAKYFGAEYLHTGDNNLWRTPGYAINKAAKLVDTLYLYVSCAEMYHYNDCLDIMSRYQDQTTLTIPLGYEDRKDCYAFDSNLPPYSLETKLPFLMGMPTEAFKRLGGYDEDFIGQGYDDNDIVDRLQAYGCNYVQTDAICVHLYHTRKDTTRNSANLSINKKLYNDRKGYIYRNPLRSSYE